MTEPPIEFKNWDTDALETFNSIIGPLLSSQIEPFKLTREQLEKMWIAAFAQGAIWALESDDFEV